MVFTEMNWAGHILAQLLNPALRSVILAGLAAIGLGIFRIRSTPARLLTWKLVLGAALAMPLLGWMLPTLSIPVANSGWDTAGSTRFVRAGALSRQSSRPVPLHAPSVERIQPVAPVPVTSEATLSPYWTAIGWSGLAISLYLVVCLVLLTRFVVGMILTRRLVSSSKNVPDADLHQKNAAHSNASGLSSIPRLVESELVCVPVTVGVFRPTILLPPVWREWDSKKLDAVIAHEVSHVARRDALTQQLSLAHRAIFWFSPLAWWLDRHLANLAEQASDEAALSCGTDRNNYARILLGFFETLQATPGRVRWQGVAMAGADRAEQRVKRILDWKGTTSMGLKRSFAVTLIICVVALVCVVAAAHPVQESQATPAPSAVARPSALSPTAPTAPPEPAAPVHGIVAVGPSPVAPMAPPDPSEAPEAPEATSDVGYSYSYGYDDRERFVIVSGKTDSLTMSGSVDDAHHVEKLRQRIAGDFIWFERDEKSYIIQDQATIDRARKFFQPQQELGKKQSELGKQQEALGKQQAELSKKMEAVRVNVPEMTAQIDKLRAELKALNSNATPEDLSHLQAELAELQARLGESQSRAGVEQSKFGSEMGELGARQGELGERQGELGRQQAELARQASRQMKELLDEAIKNGKAKPEPESEGHATL